MQNSPVDSNTICNTHENADAVYVHLLYRLFKVCPTRLMFEAGLVCSAQLLLRANAVALQVQAGAFPTVQLAASA